jgi:hypothetical protein
MNPVNEADHQAARPDVPCAVLRCGHSPHAQPHHRDGPTSAENGLGDCEPCNCAKESPGWRVTAGRDENGVHTAEFVTPTGSRYRSTAPPLPGVPDIELTELEVRIGFAIAEWDAA